MKNLKIIIILFFIALILNCKEGNEYQKINELINSNQKDEVIKGYMLIAKKKDTSYVKNLFEDLDDQRVSNNIKYKGVSVYQSKMIALREISGLSPPVKITYQKNDSIIKFYIDWAKEKGYTVSYRIN